MQCPKCNHIQNDEAQCESCGIFFAKYTAYIQSKETIASSKIPTKQQQKPEGLRNIAVIVACLVIGTVVFLAMNSESEEGLIDASVGSQNDPTDRPEQHLLGLAAKLQASHPPRNSIEFARNATVFIETEWQSLGSGFIIDSDCTVVTNKHVLKFDSNSTLKDITRSPEFLKNYMGRRQELLNKLSHLRQQYHFYLQQDPNSRELVEIERQLEEINRALEALPQDMKAKLSQEIEAQEWEANQSSFSVSLIDQTKFRINRVYYSDAHDIAIFSLPEINCPYLPKGSSQDLPQGEKLFTIGSPSGLKYTVTSGIFSGFRENKQNNFHFLQTDAPINPGNSGGPLITELGQVVGINTSILAGTEGIGFAIPIEYVDEEFKKFRQEFR